MTLDHANVVWLKAHSTARGGRGVSEIIDGLVTAARAAAPGGPVRSVVGTIDIAADDLPLERADAVLREVFDRSLAKPVSIKERSPEYRVRRGAKGRA